MIITEVIKKLDKIKYIYGDIEVRYAGVNFSDFPLLVTDISIDESCYDKHLYVLLDSIRKQ